MKRDIDQITEKGSVCAASTHWQKKAAWNEPSKSNDLSFQAEFNILTILGHVPDYVVS